MAQQTSIQGAPSGFAFGNGCIIGRRQDGNRSRVSGLKRTNDLPFSKY